MVEELGIKGLLPAYLDPALQPEDLVTGVNFASGGAGYDSLTNELETAISLEDQLKLLEEYTHKLKNIVGEEGTNSILENSMYMVLVGTNDIAYSYFNTHVRQKQFTLSSYADFLASSASNFLKELYRLGARQIGVFGAPPLGCLPSTRTLVGKGNLGRECIKEYNDGSKLFNTKLSAVVDSLNSNLSNAKVVYLDIYNPLLELIQNPNKYGFEIVNKGCCGTEAIEVAFACNALTPTCPDMHLFIFSGTVFTLQKEHIRSLFLKF